MITAAAAKKLSRAATPAPSKGRQPGQKALSSRSSKASDLSPSEAEDQENMPSRANLNQLCKGMPVPDWSRAMKNLRPEEKAIRVKQYELLEQGKEAFGVPANQDNVEFAKRGLLFC